MNYDESLSFIHSVEWLGSRPGLSRITELLRYLGNPQNSFKAVHVAGTNGKGSFCAMLESILRSAGYKTGLFTSPYIEVFEERIRFCGNVIEKDELAEIVTYIAPFCDKMSDKPTEFEIITAIGFEYFKRKKVDIAVVECGMGGRLDSTNVLPAPLLSVVTGISLDHVAFLGNTVEKIAHEKAGIIKSCTPILFGGDDPDAEKVIKSTAESLGCKYVKKENTLIKNIDYTLFGTQFSYKNYIDLQISLLGSYQPENAASVLEAVSLLTEGGIIIPEAAVRDGLLNVSWKARFEMLSSDPVIIFDGGHNSEGVKAAVKTVKLYFNDTRLAVISGVMKDKDYGVISDEISRIAETVYTVTPDNPRAMSAEEYASVFLEKGKLAIPCDSFSDAVCLAYTEAKTNNIPMICIGSLYSYSEFKAALTSLKNKENLS